MAPRCDPLVRGRFRRRGWVLGRRWALPTAAEGADSRRSSGTWVCRGGDSDGGQRGFETSVQLALKDGADSMCTLLMYDIMFLKGFDVAWQRQLSALEATGVASPNDDKSGSSSDSDGSLELDPTEVEYPISNGIYLEIP